MFVAFFHRRIDHYACAAAGENREASEPGTEIDVGLRPRITYETRRRDEFSGREARIRHAIAARRVPGGPPLESTFACGQAGTSALAGAADIQRAAQGFRDVRRDQGCGPILLDRFPVQSGSREPRDAHPELSFHIVQIAIRFFKCHDSHIECTCRFSLHRCGYG